MKKIYAIFSVLLVLAAVSCVREEPLAIDKFEKEGATVPVILSFQDPVVLQAGTKAEPGMEMGVQPAISSIHVAVFGTDRYLKDYVSAYPCDASGNPISGFASQNATSAYFIARLPISSKERVLHIIANGPSTLPFNAYENDIMQNMTVTDGNGAYWQRITLPGGITVKETDGIPQQTPDGEFIPTDATVAALSDLKLIRNFASITVTENADKFEIVSYTLCNMPKSGAIAMYSSNHSDWVSDYTAPTLSDHLYSYDGKTYPGFPTDPEIDTNIPTTPDALNAPGVSVAPGDPIYVYERAVTTDNPPFILMAARYVQSGTPTSATPIHYYRLDLALESGYFPIYRNFQYVINISDVSVDGFEDLATAAAHNSGSNFSVSLDTRTLPDVSNGVVRLHVEKPNFDWVYTAGSQKFWYMFELNANHDKINGNVTVTEKEGNAIKNLSVDNSDNANGERYVNYELNMPNGTSTLSSTLQLVGTYNDGSDTYRLVRMVTIRVFNAKDITPSLSPATVADEEGQLTTLTIPLPYDLQASMFPMEILIEDSAKALNPASTENMPVKTTGIDNLDEPFKSLSGDGKSSYCFVRTLNWSEYQRLKKNAELSGSDRIILTCDFETTKAFSSSTVYVYNKYFQTDASGVTTAQATLTGDANNNITPNRQTVSGTSATVKVKSTGNWVVNISLAGGGVAAGASLSPSNGSATTGQNVTVTLPENVSENAIRYLLTLTNTSASPSFTRTAYITQEGILMKLTSATTNISSEASSVAVTVESGTSYVLELIDAGGTVLYTSGTYSPTTGPTNHNVNIPANTSFSERRLTIRLRNLLSTAWKDVTIIQAAAVSLSVVNAQIPMQVSTARVSLSNSIPVKLRVFNIGTGAEVYTSGEIAASTVAAERTVTVGANTGSAITYRVEAWRADLSERVGNTITFVQQPSILITAASTSLKGNETSTTVYVVSDFDWVLTSSPSGATLSSSGGSATSGGTAAAVTVTLPVNYTTSDVVYTLTAKGTGANSSKSSAVAITHRKATLRTGQTVTFDCGTGTGRVFNTSSRTATKNGITATFSAISAAQNAHIRFGLNTTLSFTTDNTVYEITEASLTFTERNYRANGGSVSNGTMSWGTTSNWSKSGTNPVTSLDITFTQAYNYTPLRLSSFTITYTDYQWD